MNFIESDLKDIKALEWAWKKKYMGLIDKRDANMRMIDDVAKEYRELDLESIRLLLEIYETPGLSIRELADILSINPKRAKLKISLLATGRKTVPRSMRMNLVDTTRKISDRRKCDLTLTDDGEILAEKLKCLLVKLTKEHEL